MSKIKQLPLHFTGMQAPGIAVPGGAAQLGPMGQPPDNEADLGVIRLHLLYPQRRRGTWRETQLFRCARACLSAVVDGVGKRRPPRRALLGYVSELSRAGAPLCCSGGPMVSSSFCSDLRAVRLW
jgi:hypothetical protein